MALKNNQLLCNEKNKFQHTSDPKYQVNNLNK